MTHCYIIGENALLDGWQRCQTSDSIYYIKLAGPYWGLYGGYTGVYMGVYRWGFIDGLI